MRFNELTEQRVEEGNYDLDLSMNPIDLSSNPSFKDIIQRYTQLVYQGHASETSPEEDREYDAIEQYVAQRFGEKGSAHLQKAGEVSYWGRDDGHGSGHIRSSNLGRPNQPGGNFRTTKAGKMYGQDAKMMKNKVADRLGRHPEPALPEAYEPVSRPHGTYRSGIFSPNRGIARRSLTAVDKVLQKPLVTQQNTNRINFLLDLVPDRKLKELYGVLAYEHFPFDDLRDLPWFMKRLNLLIARAEQRLNQEQGVAEGQGDLATALSKLSGSWSGWHKEEDMSSPDVDVYEYDDGEGGYYGRGTIEHNLKTGTVKVEYHDSENDADVDGTFKNMGDAMRALRGQWGQNHGGQAPNFDRLGQRKQHGPDDLRKTDRTGRKGTLAGGPTNSLKQAIQWNKGKHGPSGKLPESMEEGNLKEFAPGNGGGESGRWYTDDQMTDLVGDGWWNDLDISGDISKQEMIQEAQAWLDDQGFSVQVLNCKVNDDDMEWYIEGSFQNSRFAKKGVAEASGKYDHRDPENHELDTPRPLIFGLKINGKIWKKDGNTVTFFTKERALAAKNSMLNKRPELEITLVQRPKD